MQERKNKMYKTLKASLQSKTQIQNEIMFEIKLGIKDQLILKRNLSQFIFF